MAVIQIKDSNLFQAKIIPHDEHYLSSKLLLEKKLEDLGPGSDLKQVLGEKCQLLGWNTNSVRIVLTMKGEFWLKRDQQFIDFEKKLTGLFV